MDKYNSTVKIHKSSHEAVIIRVYPDFPCRHYLPGQYGSLGLISGKGNKLVKRAFSISSSIINSETKDLINQKDINYYEFYLEYFYSLIRFISALIVENLFSICSYPLSI